MSSQAGFELLRPSALALALAAPLLALVAWRGLVLRRRGRELLVAPRHAARFLPGYSEGRALARIALASGALLCLALALAGPVRGYTVRNVARRGLDLVVCIDTSRSMLVRDLRPDRLSRAVREVGGLIDRLRGDRVALIAFSGDAREVAPLTHDRTTLTQLLERVSPDDNLVGGTDLGAALSAALSMFDGRTGAHEAIVVLTDGEDLAGEGYQMAETAAERGIRVYVVGMGTEAGGKIPVVDGEGGEHFLSDDSGAEVVSALSSASLEALARVTGGEYLSATRAAAPLEELYEMRISRLEGRRSDGTETVPHDRFQWALVLALALMLCEAGLRERIRPRRARAPRTTAALPRGVAALALLPLGLLGGVELGELERLSRAGEHQAALELASRLEADPTLAERERPERARIHYAAGVARALAGEDEASLESFRRARDLAGPGALREDAVYNLAAVLLGLAEEVRAEIPEIAQAAGAPPAGAPAAGLAGPGATPGANPGANQGANQGAGPITEGPDPLDVAEAAYRAAREAHLDRVRLGPPDEDTRANLELCQRRLRELEELRRQREEAQADQQQQDDQQQQQDDQQQQDPESEDQKDQEQQQDPEPGEQDPEQEPQEQDDQAESEPEPEPEQQPQPEESEADASEPEAEEEPSEPQPQPAEPEDERVMTREELQRLLDQLAEIEEEGERVRAMLTRSRRPKVEKDW